MLAFLTWLSFLLLLFSYLLVLVTTLEMILKDKTAKVRRSYELKPNLPSPPEHSVPDVSKGFSN